MSGLGDVGGGEPAELEAEPGVTAINPIGLPLKELKALQRKFHDGNQPIKLTLDKFVEALSPNEPQGFRGTQRNQWHNELETLFKKIDASCTDTVDWEEFTNYMLLHMPGFNVGDGGCELTNNPMGTDYLGALGCCHTDMINSCIVVPDIGVGGGGAGRRYITAGRDGFLKVWHPNLTLHKTIDVGHGSWLADCCWMPKSRRLAVASSASGGRIYFYESLNGTLSSDPKVQIDINSDIDRKLGTPLCLSPLSYESDGIEKEILMVGDNNGYVTVYTMDDNWTTQDSAPSSTDGKSELTRLKFDQAPFREKHHKDWVTKVGYVSEVNAWVTSGLDGVINLCDVHTGKRRTKYMDPIKLHKKGVHSWCWCRSYRHFASAGLDRSIIIWDPITQKANKVLQGHNAPILEVLVNETQHETEHQLISMSVDKVVKVWDIRTLKCVQTFTDKTEYKPEDRLTCMAFDEEGPALVLCSHTLNVLPVSVRVETSRTHLAPIVGALYNDVFHQIISGDSLGTVCVWDVRSGKLEFEFRRAHDDHKLTCLAFDEEKRRLYTGGEEGVVKLWNFSSGQELRTYTMRQPSEITGLLWAKEGPNTFVVGLAWDRRIYVWPDNTKKQAVDPKILEDSRPDAGHTDDISCILRYSGYSSSNLLATGGEDGFVVFWRDFSQSGSASYRLCDDSAGHQSDAPTSPSGVGADSVKAQQNSRARRFVGKATQGHITEPWDRGQPQGDTSGTAVSSAHKAHSRPSVAPNMIDPSLGFDDLFEDEKLGTAAGIEKMICLDRKGCLISAHTDHCLRLWTTKSFLMRLELVAPAAFPVPDDRGTSVSGVAASPASPPTPAMSSATPTKTQGKTLDKGDKADKADKASASVSFIARGGAVSSSAAAAAAAANPAASGVGLVCAQEAPVTALHAEQAENKWLFTGDTEGYVRVWDLASVPQSKYLRRLQEFKPHHQAVSFVEYFELDGQCVVSSASVDGTIALSTLHGERIGTFSSNNRRLWCLSEPSSWNSIMPPLDEGPRVAEEEDGWGLSPRRTGKGAGRGIHGRQAQAAGGLLDPRGRELARDPRRGRLGAGPGGHKAGAGTALCGQGVFSMLSGVENYPPEVGTIEEGEKAFLEKHAKHKSRLLDQ